MTTTVTALVKIGENRGRRRIWIDGKRLANAGFIGGSFYEYEVTGGQITCRLLEQGEEHPARTRKVTGRPDGKPIIDMTGRDVAEAFPTGEAVRVTFEPGLITIAPAA